LAIEDAVLTLDSNGKTISTAGVLVGIDLASRFVQSAIPARGTGFALAAAPYGYIPLLLLIFVQQWPLSLRSIIVFGTI
jgi:hypothetical protein